MTSPIRIDATPRDTRGKGAARRMRAAGQLPAVIYGHGVPESTAVTVDPRALEKALGNPKGVNAIFEAFLGDDTSYRVFVRQIQRDPVSRAIKHIDLVAPNLDKAQDFIVPLVFTGRSVGVQTGGRMRTPYREVKLHCRPEDVPANITIDVTPLDHNDLIMASQLPLPEGVTPVFTRDYVVVKVAAPRGRKAEAAAPAKKGKK